MFLGYYTTSETFVTPKIEGNSQVAANETVEETDEQQTIMIIQDQEGNYREKDAFLVQSDQVCRIEL